MVNRKNWSPGKMKKGWILYHEDAKGPGEKHFYIHEVEALEAAAGMVSGMVSEQLDDMDEGEPGEPDPIRDNLLEIRQLISTRPRMGLEAWESFHRNFLSRYAPTVRMEEGFVHGV